MPLQLCCVQSLTGCGVQEPGKARGRCDKLILQCLCFPGTLDRTDGTNKSLVGSAGSSGGSGAALAARLTPLATCEDTGGDRAAVLHVYQGRCLTAMGATCHQSVCVCVCVCEGHPTGQQALCWYPNITDDACGERGGCGRWFLPHSCSSRWSGGHAGLPGLLQLQRWHGPCLLHQGSGWPGTYPCMAEGPCDVDAATTVELNTSASCCVSTLLC